MDHLSFEEYRELVETVVSFNDETGKMPSYTLINNKKIEKEDYILIIEQVNSFYLEMGRSPELIKIKK